MPSRAILIVEDNEDHAELLRRSLGDLDDDLVIRTVGDGEAALDYLEHGRGDDVDHNPRPDLILLDLRLPRLDGHELLRRLKQSARWRRIPVVILTTSAARADVERAYDSHANGYLVKPVERGALAGMMESVRSYWTIWNQVSPT